LCPLRVFCCPKHPESCQIFYPSNQAYPSSPCPHHLAKLKDFSVSHPKNKKGRPHFSSKKIKREHAEAWGPRGSLGPASRLPSPRGDPGGDRAGGGKVLRTVGAGSGRPPPPGTGPPRPPPLGAPRVHLHPRRRPLLPPGRRPSRPPILPTPLTSLTVRDKLCRHQKETTFCSSALCTYQTTHRKTSGVIMGAETRATSAPPPKAEH